MNRIIGTTVGCLLAACTSPLWAGENATLAATTLASAGKGLAELPSRKPEQRVPELKAVGTANINVELTAGQEALTVEGRASFKLNANEMDLKKQMVSLGAFNLVLADVSQQMLTYGGVKGTEMGTLGFAASPNQRLRYNSSRGVLEGEVAGYLSADYMGAYAQPIGDARRDHTVAPRQQASLSLSIQLERPFEEGAAADEPIQQEATLDLRLRAKADGDIAAQPLTARVIDSAIIVDHVITIWWEVAQNLCLQPVRIGRLTWHWDWPVPTLQSEYTGDGLNFGMPGANSQWAKADVNFTVRDWKTVWRSDLFDFSTTEAGDLLDEVDDADCVEVYFVEGDNGMHTNWGGGATFWSGESYTKIISSDGNVPPSIDLTHLAHELGHAMDLPHPTGAAGVSTNTLMCPSGFLNDNPARNSQENEDNLSNPLLTFSLKLISAGPDCVNSADCGACP